MSELILWSRVSEEQRRTRPLSFIGSRQCIYSTRAARKKRQRCLQDAWKGRDACMYHEKMKTPDDPWRDHAEMVAGVR